MTIGAAYETLIRALQTVYDPREAASVADLVLESRFGLRRLDRIVRKAEPLATGGEALLKADLDALLHNRPVQYILGEAWFDGLLLKVSEDVLIPRPETEELVHWIAEDKRGGRILDIGTGSGCIAIALKKRLPELEVHALDVSGAALALASVNAQRCETPLFFHQINFLDETTWPSLPDVTVLVSNPPYIAESETGTLHERVLTREPHLALFVPDSDPLVFYRKIARFARPGTTVYVEINEALGRETAAAMEAEGLTDIVLRRDMQGKDRMIRASR
jgi:release factor glutamine methyltransferase